jgi:diguanylate cyclase (GGDEF)-like protein
MGKTAKSQTLRVTLFPGEGAMRAWVLVTVATLLGVAFVVVLRIPAMSDTAVLVLSNGGQLLAAVLASAGCAVASRRTTDHRRRAWRWLSIGTGAWAAGQLVWSYYEVVLGQEVPFPSLADVGFLLFPVAAAVGLVTWLGSQSSELAARGRDLLDGMIIAGSLLVLSWVTALGSVVAEGGDGWFSLTLSLAYPVGDLVLGTLVLMALARGDSSERTTLAILTVGLGGLAFADSAYVYLVSLERYSSADTVSSGWVIGFLFVGAAGWSVRRQSARSTRTPSALMGPKIAGRSSMVRLVLPYLPLVAAGTALCVSLIRAPETPTTDLLLGVGLVLVVLTRQFLAMTDNQRLLVALGDARDQLQHQALHDALTGLANRVLFADRLDRALLQPEATVSVLFCDLDDFKHVNDDLGHEAGDVLLQRVADRLLDCVRATDTVARLGGDEFAILLEDSGDAVQVADRVVDAMTEPVEVAGRELRTSISVGIAHHQGTAPPPTERRTTAPRTRSAVPAGDTDAAAHRETTAQLLLRQADGAMYAAKGAGKSRAVLADVAAE